MAILTYIGPCYKSIQVPVQELFTYLDLFLHRILAVVIVVVVVVVAVCSVVAVG